MKASKRYRYESYFWLATIPPTVLFLRESVLWVAFLSIYALTITARGAAEAALAKESNENSTNDSNGPASDSGNRSANHRSTTIRSGDGAHDYDNYVQAARDNHDSPQNNNDSAESDDNHSTPNDYDCPADHYDNDTGRHDLYNGPGLHDAYPCRWNAEGTRKYRE